MGTETPLGRWVICGTYTSGVKLNNPLMGRETHRRFLAYTYQKEVQLNLLIPIRGRKQFPCFVCVYVFKC